MVKWAEIRILHRIEEVTIMQAFYQFLEAEFVNQNLVTIILICKKELGFWKEIGIFRTYTSYIKHSKTCSEFH